MIARLAEALETEHLSVLAAEVTHELRVRDASAQAWDEGHEQGYDSGLYAREDAEPETVETRSLEMNPYREVPPARVAREAAWARMNAILDEHGDGPEYRAAWEKWRCLVAAEPDDAGREERAR